MNKSAYDHISENNTKTTILMIAFTLILIPLFGLVAFVLLYLGNSHLAPMNVIINETIDLVKRFSFVIVGASAIWFLIVWLTGDQIMLGFSGATELTKENPENKKIYNLVENAALAAGLPCPKIYVIQDQSLNAFATGNSPRNASVALTSGIIEKLNSRELQGVIAHELGHIGNRDIRLNMIMISGISVFGLIGDFCFRMSGGSKKNNNVFFMAIGITFLLFHFIVAPLLQLAVSRTREYAADATAALITRDPKALASALKKISMDSRVESLDSSKTMAIACIHTPLATNTLSFFSLMSTHPPIQERIRRLENM